MLLFNIKFDTYYFLASHYFFIHMPQTNQNLAGLFDCVCCSFMIILRFQCHLVAVYNCSACIIILFSVSNLWLMPNYQYSAIFSDDNGNKFKRNIFVWFMVNNHYIPTAIFLLCMTNARLRLQTNKKQKKTKKCFIMMKLVEHLIVIIIIFDDVNIESNSQQLLCREQNTTCIKNYT